MLGTCVVGDKDHVLEDPAQENTFETAREAPEVTTLVLDLWLLNAAWHLPGVLQCSLGRLHPPQGSLGSAQRVPWGRSGQSFALTSRAQQPLC